MTIYIVYEPTLDGGIVVYGAFRFKEVAEEVARQLEALPGIVLVDIVETKFHPLLSPIPDISKILEQK
jgi:hypothetical protein